MSYHYSLGSLSTHATAQASRVSAQAGRTQRQVVAQAGRTSGQIKGAASAVSRGIVRTVTAPARAVKSLEDAANSANAAARAAGAKADNTVELIRESKKKLEAAKAYLEANRLSQAHWDKIDQLETRFNQTLNMLPLTSRLALIQEFERKVDMLFILAVVGLLGSTGLLWFFFGREKKPESKKRTRKPPTEEYIEIAPGDEIPEGYEIVEI